MHHLGPGAHGQEAGGKHFQVGGPGYAPGHGGELLAAACARRAGEGGLGGSSLPQPLRETLEPLVPSHDYARTRLYRGVHARRETGHRVAPEPGPTSSGQEPKYTVRRSDGEESGAMRALCF